MLGAPAYGTIARVLEMDLLTVPSFGEALFDEFRAVTLLTDPQLTVFYQVLYAENLIEFVDIEPVEAGADFAAAFSSAF